MAARGATAPAAALALLAMDVSVGVVQVDARDARRLGGAKLKDKVKIGGITWEA